MSEKIADDPQPYEGDAQFEVDDEMFERESIRELAKRLSRDADDNVRLYELMKSVSNTPAQNPFDEDISDSYLDPNSPNFNSAAWARNMYRIFQADPERYKQRQLGLAYRNLAVFGYGTDADYQMTVYNALLKLVSFTKHALTGFKNGTRVDILRPMDGIINPGDMVVVLGRPGAGCSTFLKTAAVQTYGFHVDKESVINYTGLTAKNIRSNFRGDVIYSAESETHFPHLTAGDTLLFAAKMRTPDNRIPGVSREKYAEYMRDVVMATFGLSHTKNTKVGSDIVRGISGGERKRVSIAEVYLSGAPFQCWDNSTRGLDSATALEFIRTLRVSSEMAKVTSLVAVYQSSEEMYNLFDKVVLLYEGRQIYFGSRARARNFFYEMGFEPRPRQPTPDFLTSLSSPHERVVRKGYEGRVPQTPDQFEARWKASPEYAEISAQIDEFMASHPTNSTDLANFKESHVARQAKSTRHSSSYTVSFGLQIKYLIGRGYKRIQGNSTMQATTLFGNNSFAFILGSVFYNLPDTTSSFYRRSALLFFAILFNAFGSFLEIFSLYEARPIIQKHKMYALYDPTADALASVLTEMPLKVIVAIIFNPILYFLSNLRRTPGHFFVYLLVSFFSTLAMSHLFRTVGSYTKSISEAMIPATVLLLAMTIYTGFVIPVRDMLGWARWINYINPIAYGFEAVMVNEFHDRNFPCSQFVPSGPMYQNLPPDNHVCSGVGAVLGQDYINGDVYLYNSYLYQYKHLWRDFGIVLAFGIFFLFTYLAGVYFNPGARTKGEMLVFQRSTLKKLRKEAKVRYENSTSDVESGSRSKEDYTVNDGDSSSASGVGDIVETSNDIFYWKDVCYDIKIKKEDRRLLDHVDGWVKPGTLTALMGASGAGKTTLLDTLANRVTMGVVTGHMYVNGNPRDDSFQRSTGYAQQQDLHLETTTVREALTFSAVLRQPREVPHAKKIAYVDNVLKILEMEPYADAVVGVPGEGLNVEQRKRLTIGVELAAKPKLLLFLDEPTSGLDSQTAWSVCQLMKKLSNAGQAILCTIHQPSALLLQEFDRLLFLANGGRTVYFGEIGNDSKTLTGYFEKYGADPCPPDANPAEWMLHVIGAAPGSIAKHDYAEVWKNSEERLAIRAEIDRMMAEFGASDNNVPEASMRASEFAAPLWKQYLVVTHRVFQQYWRSPRYIWAKIFLSVFSALFNGFSFFKANNSQQGLQDLLFSIFMLTFIFNSSVQQLIPYFVTQRSLYEVRERPSKIFSWKAFLAAMITVELPWQILVATLTFFCWYYPVGLYHNAAYTDQVHSRGGLMYFYVLLFFIYIPTMAQMCVAGMELGDTAANVASLLFTMALLFCGALATPQALPGFWIFMYRVSPFTYLMAGMLTVGVANSPVVCAANEYISMDPIAGQTCQEFLGPYIEMAGGYLVNGNATSACQFCTVSTSNTYLESISAPFSIRWRNLGIFIAYPVFQVVMTFFFYWLNRVPKKKDRVKRD